MSSTEPGSALSSTSPAEDVDVIRDDPSSTDADAAARLERSQRVARWLDVRWTLPGTRIGVGLDALVGLLPVVGDAASAASSLWIVDQARRAGVRRRALARMLGNVLVDLGVGSVPLVGDVFDVAWRANRRNVAVFERELERAARGRE